MEDKGEEEVFHLNDSDAVSSDSDKDENDSQKSSGSTSDSDSDSEDESSLREEIEKLESELTANPSLYDAHVKYIQLLRKVYEIEKLNAARETMSSMFPLTPEMWMEWARDEAAQSSSLGTEALSAVEKIYDSGVSEYLSVPLWCEYLSYVEQHVECSSIGISKIRNLYERAVTAAGSHVSEGNKIWEAYREFEIKLLDNNNEADTKDSEAQIQRIRNIFHRNLSIPLLKLKSTLSSYKMWEAELNKSAATEIDDLEGIPPHVASAYQKANTMLSERMELEEHISNKKLDESDKFQWFKKYLNFEKLSGDPARAQLIYERAVAEFPVSTDLWLDYTGYLDKTLKVGNVLRDVYSRAIKNCSWVAELWVRFLLCLERSHASPEQISTIFDKSLQCSFSTLEEYLDLFLTRVDGLRRKIQSCKDDNSLIVFSSIRDTFQYASDYLSPQMKNTEGLLNLHAYWARLEHSLAHDLPAARGVWESLLKSSGSMLEAWLGYIRMEIELGNVNEARAIYKRCFSKRFPGTGSEEICRSWLRFEREFGLLEDFDHAVLKVTPRLNELQLYQQQQELKATTIETTATTNTREKRKSSSKSTSDDQSPAKKQKRAPKTQSKKHEDTADIPKNPKIETRNTESVSDTNPNQSKQKPYTDQCTVFISNLSLQAKNEDVNKFFSDVGGVVSIRILLNKFTGKSRGLAYVDFTDDEHLAAALAKNKQSFFGKKLSIVRSDPKNRKKDRRYGPGEGGENSERRNASSGNVELKGSVTFAMPRNLQRKSSEEPKSNDEFRKMFIKNT